MRRMLICLAAVGLTCLATLSVVNVIRSADPPPAQRAQAPNQPAVAPVEPPSVTVPGPKATIEKPTERILADKTAPAQAPVNTTAAPMPPYITKTLVIEKPAESLVRATSNTTPTAPSDKFVNPKVEPGKVKWHPNFATACKAAEQSGKPVLLFQMMGRLDDRFC
jgi:hypothetical protein